jgi:transcriptional regulator with XRE-family HTH domain
MTSMAKPISPAIKRANRRVGEDVLTWRKLRGLTQAQLADRAGVGRATLVNLERGEGGITMESLLKILRALGILESLTRALDPYESDIGRLRAGEELPQRVRRSGLIGRGDG